MSALAIMRRSRGAVCVKGGENRGADQMNYAEPTTKEGLVSEEERTHPGGDVKGETDS